MYKRQIRLNQGHWSLAIFFNILFSHQISTWGRVMVGVGARVMAMRGLMSTKTNFENNSRTSYVCIAWFKTAVLHQRCGARINTHGSKSHNKAALTRHGRSRPKKTAYLHSLPAW